ncbi:MAG: bifunctional ADP-dependent NAD(P)H-hydrate dehydratase/NAD(P)H-hydrate epimerase [Thiothrix sp.]|nr:MAG: bifunctional ADP-dependent NAD(P)H-hydrate dehydratase/NAD(P)H-hydrate epimerase [Thiothrix sp.]
MIELSRCLYTASQIRAIEQAVTHDYDVTGYTLMKRAGQTVFDACRGRLEKDAHILVMCGPGNNGGDGYVVARLLQESDYSVQVMSLCVAEKLEGDAALARDAWEEAGGKVEAFHGALPETPDLIVDAMLGTGLERNLEGDLLVAVQLVNESPAPVIAVDIPTGLNSETGIPMGSAVIARQTVTFVGLKLGLFIGLAADYCGAVLIDDLDSPEGVYKGLPPAAIRSETEDIIDYLPARPNVCQKGDFGHVLVVGGDAGLSGAARMSAEAAARVGSGLVSVATHPLHAAFINMDRPEIMSHGIESGKELLPLFKNASVVVAGPGLGRGKWAEGCWQELLGIETPMVVDADALNLLAKEPTHQDNWVLTPHPGEAGRLLGVTAEEIQSDRLKSVITIQARYGGVAVLKGSGSLIASSTGVVVCGAGNPGMASGGMGDVLTGVIAGLLAQGLPLDEAAHIGVLIHAHAGDLAAGEAPRGMLATDLLARLREVVNP